MRDGEVVSVRDGNNWKSARSARVSQVLPSSRPYKVETARDLAESTEETVDIY